MCPLYSSRPVFLTETGTVDDEGSEQDMDVVMCPAGFNTFFTPLFKVYGLEGREIHEQSADFPLRYQGVAAENSSPTWGCLLGYSN
jgi:hypothetical protein